MTVGGIGELGEEKKGLGSMVESILLVRTDVKVAFRR
jgi:hypothetical protein